MDLRDPIYQAMLGNLGLDSASKPDVVFDSSDDDYDKDEITLDAALEDVRTYSDTVDAIHTWLETDDLDDDENFAQRLFSLFYGIFDVNKNNELDEDENEVLAMILNAAWEYFTSKGVSEEDANALLNDGDANAATRVFDLLLNAMPDGQEAVNSDIDSFAWGDNEQEPMMLDSANGMLKKLGGIFKKVFAIRNGKKVRINKRIGGVARLTAKQKAAARKLHAKPISATARLRRRKSMRLSKMMGLSGG